MTGSGATLSTSSSSDPRHRLWRVSPFCSSCGIPCFGPKASGAHLEGSKLFAKELMERHGNATAKATAFDAKDDAIAYLAERSAPIVVKATVLPQARV